MSGKEDLFWEGEGAPSGLSENNSEASPFAEAIAQAGERIGRGRPKGARNKKQVDFERWFYAMGFKDPAQFLAELVTADPLALRTLAKENAAWDDAPSLLDVVKIQIAAAGELMPYLHGKKPIEVVVTDERLPLLVIELGTNQNAIAADIASARALSIGAPLELDDQAEVEPAKPSISGPEEDSE